MNRKPLLPKAASKIGTPTIVYFLFMVIFLGYYVIEFKPNVHMTEDLDELNQTINVSSIYYGRDDSVPVKLFGKNNTQQLGTTQAGVLLVASLLYMVVVNSKREYDIMDEVDSKNIIDAELSAMNKVKEFVVLPQTFLIYRTIDKGERKPAHRWIFASVSIDTEKHPEEGGNKYLAFNLDPFTGYKNETLVLDELPKGFKIRCGDCGRFPDEKIFTPEGFKEMMEDYGLKISGSG